MEEREKARIGLSLDMFFIPQLCNDPDGIIRECLCPSVVEHEGVHYLFLFKGEKHITVCCREDRYEHLWYYVKESGERFEKGFRHFHLVARHLREVLNE